MKMNVETLEAHTFFTTTFFFFSGPCLGERNLKMHLFGGGFLFFSDSEGEGDTSQTHISIGFTTSKGFHNYLLLQAGLAFFVQNCEFLMKHYCQETIISLTKKLQIMAKWEF